MCKLIMDEISKAQIRRMFVLSAKENSQSMAQELSHPTRSKMPKIAKQNTTADISDLIAAYFKGSY